MMWLRSLLIFLPFPPRHLVYIGRGEGVEGGPACLSLGGEEGGGRMEERERREERKKEGGGGGTNNIMSSGVCLVYCGSGSGMLGLIWYVVVPVCTESALTL